MFFFTKSMICCLSTFQSAPTGTVFLTVPANSCITTQWCNFGKKKKCQNVWYSVKIFQFILTSHTISPLQLHRNQESGAKGICSKFSVVILRILCLSLSAETWKLPVWSFKCECWCAVHPDVIHMFALTCRWSLWYVRTAGHKWSQQSRTWDDRQTRYQLLIYGNKLQVHAAALTTDLAAEHWCHCRHISV